MQTARPRVVVVGAGFAGIAAVKRLRGAPVDVTLIDRHNYHLFTPLLYEVASALLDPSEIAAPVRGMLHGARNVDFKLGTVDHIDLLQRRVVTDAGNLDYDYLIVAAGSVNNFFGIQSAETHTFALKELGAALALRNHVLSCFERASWSTDAEMRRHLQSFVVVGGGPTGIEFAGALHGLIHLVLRKDFRGLDMSEVSVQVLEATDRLLGAFAPDLAMAAARRLQDIGVEVLLKAQVESVDGSGVHLADGRELPAATVV